MLQQCDIMTEPIFIMNGTDEFPESAPEGSIFQKSSTGEMYRLVNGTWKLIEEENG